MASKVRLFVDHPLAEGQTVPLEAAQAHYLSGVMRLPAGSVISVFDGQSGEFDARLAQANKRGGTLEIGAQTRPLQPPPDLWLCFAPIKKARTDFIVEKAAEMGAARIVPVLTEFTNSERVRVDRLQAHAVEAAEQCGGTYVPQVAEPVKLAKLLDGWPDERSLMFCDETLVGETGRLPDMPGPWAVLIGPEGGFSDRERGRLRGLERAHPVSLGPRILRADTAAVAALTLWQTTLGDWR
ncbi:16S rRNA (uracil(1498)-N(3))-methyltransferase [Limimaricola hongkongensis]|uniref:Ribosomal RNA small subunit methyltransferase E n=1 Tax=Limimaricola hongkongensis DSM 17492 TaxID=1122180 RepID=A0A017HE05_9RHOB|nr:16S rRNA (uracil(1498)-N(3))-methyltransferase [Limimaricola hongkongensis]EYD72014.1 Ribosomal RNA small subunit methyltransferase E [Limimaricola hongkongensis DSM 17492]